MKMKLFKRNAVIITAVAFLGVAVYLNWSYGKNEDNAAAGLSGSSEDVLINEYSEQDEDVLSYALFGPVATKYFEFRQAEKYKIDPTLGDKETKVHPM